MKKVPLSYIFPNLITLCAACFGITAAKFGIENDFTTALQFLFVAAFLDALDGRMARLLNASSEFGAEWDSLSDFAAFGVSPTLIIYYWGLSGLDSLGWGACLFYTACCGLRLARFNVLNEKEASWKKTFFKGIPAPVGAILLVFPIVFEKNFPDLLESHSVFIGTWVLLVGIMMISSIPTFSFKGIKIEASMRRWLLVFAALILALTLHDFWFMVMVLSFLYVVFIPFSALHYRRMDEKHRVEEAPKNKE